MRGAQVIITLIKIKNKKIYILKKGVEHVNLVCVREREREREFSWWPRWTEIGQTEN